jgi:choline kinase
MNILIPMAGLGSRFLTKGFKIPKPLIDVNGKVMIIRAIQSLGINNAKYLFVIAKNEYSNSVRQEISKYVKFCGLKVDYLNKYYTLFISEYIRRFLIKREI